MKKLISPFLLLASPYVIANSVQDCNKSADTTYSCFYDNGNSTVTQGVFDPNKQARLLKVNLWKICLEGQNYNLAEKRCDGRPLEFTWDSANELSRNGFALPNVEQLQSIFPLTSTNSLEENKPFVTPFPRLNRQFRLGYWTKNRQNGGGVFVIGHSGLTNHAENKYGFYARLVKVIATS